MTNWSKLKVVDLKAKLNELGLSTQGLKQDLVDRLTEYESKQAASAAAAAEPAAAETQPESEAAPQEAAAPEQEQPVQPPQEPEQAVESSQKESVAVAEPAKDLSAEEPLEAAGEASQPGSQAEPQGKGASTKASTPKKTAKLEAEASGPAATKVDPEPDSNAKGRGKGSRGTPTKVLEPDVQPAEESKGTPQPAVVPPKAAPSAAAAETNIVPAAESEKKGNDGAVERNLLDDLVGGDDEELEIEVEPRITPTKQPRVEKTENLAVKVKDVAKATPKEPDEFKESVKIIPQASMNPTQALRIDNFVRPFTEPMVRELLSAYGNIKGMWMPSIKTHCYVIFESKEEAEACRQATYDLQWPEGHGRKLVPRFVELQEAEAIISSGGPLSAATTPRHENGSNKGAKDRGRLFTREEAELRRVASGGKQAEEAAQSLKEEAEKKRKRVEEPLSLDDLFKKTATKPHIYWLPLTEEQVKAKKTRMAVLEAARKQEEDKVATETRAKAGDDVGPKDRQERSPDRRRGSDYQRDRRSPDRRSPPPQRKRDRSPDSRERRR